MIYKKPFYLIESYVGDDGGDDTDDEGEGRSDTKVGRRTDCHTSCQRGVL